MMPGDREGQDDGRPGLFRADADQRENARADDRADAERHQMRPGQGFAQAVLGGHILMRRDRLAGIPVLHAHAPPVLLLKSMADRRGKASRWRGF
jgi:hypothetical protein